MRACSHALNGVQWTTQHGNCSTHLGFHTAKPVFHNIWQARPVALSCGSLESWNKTRKNILISHLWHKYLTDPGRISSNLATLRAFDFAKRLDDRKQNKFIFLYPFLAVAAEPVIVEVRLLWPASSSVVAKSFSITQINGWLFVLPFNQISISSGRYRPAIQDRHSLSGYIWKWKDCRCVCVRV